MLRFWRATINTRNGLAFAIRSEQAVREELSALALALPLAWLVGTTAMRSVELVALGGERRVFGFLGRVMGPLKDKP